MQPTIIYVHTGNSSYLLPNLLHTKSYNPKARIILIGNTLNEYVKKFGIEHHPLSNYMAKANEFKKIYKHYSPNSFSFELFCFQRWFAIYEFVCSEKIESFLVCDTDALLYCDVTNEFDKYIQADFTITRNGTPCFVYFKRDKLQKFTEYIIWCYTSEEGFKRITNYHKHLINQNKPYGISDMSAFTAWENLDGAKSIHIDKPVTGTNLVKEAYDHNFIDAKDGYKMEKGHKLTVWENGIPYQFIASNNEKIRILGIHLQGNAKFLLHKMIPLYYIKPVWPLYAKEYLTHKLRQIKHIIVNK